MRLGVVPAQGGEPVWMDLGETRISTWRAWTGSRMGRLAAQIENREQTALDLMRFDPQTGQGNLAAARDATKSGSTCTTLFKPLKQGGLMPGCFCGPRSAAVSATCTCMNAPGAA